MKELLVEIERCKKFGCPNCQVGSKTTRRFGILELKHSLHCLIAEEINDSRRDLVPDACPFIAEYVVSEKEEKGAK